MTSKELADKLMIERNRRIKLQQVVERMLAKLLADGEFTLLAENISFEEGIEWELYELSGEIK